MDPRPHSPKASGSRLRVGDPLVADHNLLKHLALHGMHDQLNVSAEDDEMHGCDSALSPLSGSAEHNQSLPLPPSSSASHGDIHDFDDSTTSPLSGTAEHNQSLPLPASSSSSSSQPALPRRRSFPFPDTGLPLEVLPESSAFLLDTSIERKHHSTKKLPFPPHKPTLVPNTPMKSPTISRVFGSAGWSPSVASSSSSAPSAPSTAKKLRSHGHNHFLSHFDHVGLIGQGTYASVYSARSRADGKLYAIKQTRRTYRGHADRAIAWREVENHKLLMSPSTPLASSSSSSSLSFTSSSARGLEHCVKYYDSWEEEGLLYIQMELCERGNLADFLQYSLQFNDTLDESLIWSFIADIAAALNYMHHHGLTHMDVTPQNVFLDMKGHFKIGDFGIAKNSLTSKRDMDFQGNMAYLAPEVIQPSVGSVGPPADVYSLGIIAFEMAADVDLPHVVGSDWENLRNDDVPFASNCSRSPELQTLIRQMMTRNPLQRPTAEQILSHPKVVAALRHGDHPTTAKLPPPIKATPVRLNTSSLATTQRRRNLEKMFHMGSTTPPRNLAAAFDSAESDDEDMGGCLPKSTNTSFNISVDLLNDFDDAETDLLSDNVVGMLNFDD